MVKPLPPHLWRLHLIPLSFNISNLYLFMRYGLEGANGQSSQGFSRGKTGDKVAKKASNIPATSAWNWNLLLTEVANALVRQGCYCSISVPYFNSQPAACLGLTILNAPVLQPCLYMAEPHFVHPVQATQSASFLPLCHYADIQLIFAQHRLVR